MQAPQLYGKTVCYPNLESGPNVVILARLFPLCFMANALATANPA
jgi:hypothetical protein